MNVAGDGMCIPRDDGDGAGTNDDGDGTWRVGLPGDGAMEDGVTTGWREGGDASGKLAMPGDDWKIEKWLSKNIVILITERTMVAKLISDLNSVSRPKIFQKLALQIMRLLQTLINTIHVYVNTI